MNKNAALAMILGLAGPGAISSFSGREALDQEKRDRNPELVSELKSAAESKRARKAAKRLNEKRK